MSECTRRDNTVQMSHEQGVVGVITTTNFDVKQPHNVTRKLLMQQILPTL